MDLSEDRDWRLLALQKQRFSRLVKKSRRMDARLAELRSEDYQMELKDLSLSDCSEENIKKGKDLNDQVNQLKAEYSCLSYKKNVYNGLILPSLIDYMPDQPVKNVQPVTTPTSSHASGGIPKTSDTQSWSCPHCSSKNHPTIDKSVTLLFGLFSLVLIVLAYFAHISHIGALQFQHYKINSLTG